MCGFLGVVSDFLTVDYLYRGLAWIKRRGPDSQRTWLSADRRVGLLHAQLTIVDKDPKAQQPLSNIEAGITAAFVGEIYNYRELKRQFPHYHFKTESDTEVILAAYQTYGREGLNLLKGMFSLAIVDEKQKKIILARDPIGKKPLFFAQWGGQLLFGTSLLSLTALYNKPVTINEESLSYFWQRAHINPQVTILSGTAPVLPGKILEFNFSGELINTYSCLPKALYLYNGETPEKIHEITHELLLRAVKQRLSNNPKPTMLLSGGIDSTVLTTFTKRVCDSDKSLPKVKVLTLRSFIPLINDEFYARYAAYRIRVQLQLVGLASTRLQEEVIQAFDLQDEPLGMISFFLVARLVKAMSSFSRILLTGDGGDETFLGYGKPADWYVRTGINITNGPQRYGLQIPAWMSPWAKETVTDTLVGHMLAKVDRASAEQGVEIRCPFLDYDLVSYTRSLPFEILTYGNRTKALLKAQLRGWPHWFLERPKIGFAYNLRWLWGLSRYSGLREGIDRRAIDAFERHLPASLRYSPLRWRTQAIFRHFETCWRLLAWSRFLVRLDNARTSQQS